MQLRINSQLLLLVISTTLVLTSFLVFTKTPSEEVQASIEQICNGVRKMAKGTMMIRQGGATLKKAMDNLPKDVEPLVYKLRKSMTLKAFEIPRQTLKEFQDYEITEFENRYYRECLKSNAKSIFTPEEYKKLREKM
ncbi:hypothetical protein [Aliikangiella coralliicola]|uniref:Uncharacterized protein n=1 Tax=Aliikangiella coralliicola TaxID=2592383 RepID=A0A545UD16_9GAMM|nr:hypothetical protein [Aliikangiella coralliicola]TQV87360.1 hypothetical protein FLL46_13005 [Aliikangiella coralliicola]